MTADDHDAFFAPSLPPRRHPPPRRAVVMWLSFYASFQLFALFVAATTAPTPKLRNMVYLTGQHPLVPTHLPQIQDVTHVALAFMRSDVFNDAAREGRATTADDWPLFTSVAAVRRQFAPGARILVALGGWGDTAGFAAGAKTVATRARFARNVAAMVAATGADGVDIDWEYPGGNGDDYRHVPNAEKAWEVEAYVQLVAALRRALGPDKVLSAAVPGRPEDIALAWTPATVPRLLRDLDFLSVMAYDLLNRRDHVTAHHTGIAASRAAIEAYRAAGAPPTSTGFALGCPTQLLEDPDTGDDLGRIGMFSWHDHVPDAVRTSFARAQANGTDDGDGYAYWDAKEDLWWTYDTPSAISRKIQSLVSDLGLGGAFSWGLGEDAPQYEHFQAMCQAYRRIRDGAGTNAGARDEL